MDPFLWVYRWAQTGPIGFPQLGYNMWGTSLKWVDSSLSPTLLFVHNDHILAEAAIKSLESKHLCQCLQTQYFALVMSGHWIIEPGADQCEPRTSLWCKWVNTVCCRMGSLPVNPSECWSLSLPGQQGEGQLSSSGCVLWRKGGKASLGWGWETQEGVCILMLGWITFVDKKKNNNTGLPSDHHTMRQTSNVNNS